MNIKKDKKVEEIVKIINNNTEAEDFYLGDDYDLTLENIIEILNVDISGANLHFSYCGILAKIWGYSAASLEEKENYKKALKNFISVIEDFSKKNNTIYWYNESEEKETKTGIDIVYQLVEQSKKSYKEFSPEENLFDNSIFQIFDNDEDEVVDLLGIDE